MGAVGDETARVDAFAEGMEDRQPLSARKLGQEFRVKHRALLCEHNEAIRPISRKGGKSAFDVLRRRRTSPRFGDDEMAPPEAHRHWLVGSFDLTALEFISVEAHIGSGGRRRRHASTRANSRG